MRLRAGAVVLLVLTLALVACEPGRYPKELSPFQAATLREFVTTMTERSGVTFELAADTDGAARLDRPITVSGAPLPDQILLLQAIYGLRFDWRWHRYVVSVPRSLDDGAGLLDRVTRRWNETVLSGTVVDGAGKPVAGGRVWAVERQPLKAGAPAGADMAIAIRVNALGESLNPSSGVDAAGRFELRFDERRFGGPRDELVLIGARGGGPAQAVPLRRDNAVLTLTRKDDVHNVDVGRITLQSVAVSGTAVTPDGKPAVDRQLWLVEVEVPNAADTRNLNVVLRFSADGTPVNGRKSVRTDARGQFTFELPSVDKAVSYLLVVSDKALTANNAMTPLLRADEPVVARIEPGASLVTLGELQLKPSAAQP